VKDLLAITHAINYTIANMALSEGWGNFCRYPHKYRQVRWYLSS